MACRSEEALGRLPLTFPFVARAVLPDQARCADVSRPPAAALFSAPSRRAVPRSRDPEARSNPIPAPRRAREALGGVVSRPGVRSRVASPGPVTRAGAGDNAAPKVTAAPPVLVPIPGHAALPPSKLGTFSSTQTARAPRRRKGRVREGRPGRGRPSGRGSRMPEARTGVMIQEPLDVSSCEGVGPLPTLP